MPTWAIFGNIDTLDEPDEVVTATISADPDNALPAGVTISTSANSASVTIRDDDPTEVTLSRTDSGAIREGGTGTEANAQFTVTLGRALVAVGGVNEVIEVPLVLSGTGIAAGDYSLSATGTGVMLSGTNTLTPVVKFTGAGAQTATITLTPATDSAAEGTETLTVALGPDGTGTNGFDVASRATNVGGGADPHESGSPAVTDRFEVDIEDGAGTPTPVITVDEPAAVTEGDDITWTLTATPPPAADLTVNYWIGDASGTSDFLADGDSGDASVTIGTGGTATVTVSTVNDSFDEPDAFVTMNVYPNAAYTRGDPSSDEVLVRDDDEGLSIVESGGSTSVNESGAGNTDTYTVVLSSQPSASVTVALTTSSGAATVNPTSLTFNRTGAKLWSAPQTVMVTGVSDGVDQPGSPGSRSVDITHTGTSTDANYAGNLGTVGVTVLDDDAVTAPVSFERAAYEVEEGSATPFRLRRTGGTAAVTVPLLYRAGTATAGADYFDGPASVTIAAGGDGYSPHQGIGSRTDALIDEPDETFTIAIDADNLPAGFRAGAIATATVTIKRLRLDERISLELAPDGDLPEGATKTVRLFLSRPFHLAEVNANARFDVDLTLGGAATRGTDYTLVCGGGEHVAGCANLAGGTPRVTVSDAGLFGNVEDALRIVATPDSVAEAGGETVTVTAGGTTRQLKIVDAPASVSVGWAAATGLAQEGEGGYSAEPELVVTPAAGMDITVPLIYTDGTAEAGKDFRVVTAAATIPAGTSRFVVQIPIVDDALYELDETFTVAIDTARLPARVTAGSQTSVEVTIRPDASDVSTVQFAAENFEADEGQVAEVELTLSAPFPTDVTVTVLPTPQTATEFGIDYAVGPYQATFEAGETRAVLPIQLVDDNDDENTETFFLTILSGNFLPAGVTLGTQHLATVHIHDGPPVVYIVVPEGGFRFPETGPGTFYKFEARLSRPLSGSVSVVLDASCAPAPGELPCATRGEDYPNLGNARPFQPGDTSPIGPWVFPIPRDNKAEGEERFEVSLRVFGPNPEGVVVGTATRPGRATVVIEDGLPLASFARAASAADEDAGAVDVTVRFSPAPNEALTLSYAVGGTADEGPDFTIAGSGTLNVVAGESTATITVTVIDDSDVEPDETVVLTLTDGTGYALGRKVHTLTLADDDTPPVPEASFALGTSEADEDGGAVEVTVNISPAPNTNLTLSYTVDGTADENADFTITGSGTLSVAPGASEATISVTPLDDGDYEGAETAVLTLTDGGGYAVGSTNVHTLTLVDDEEPPVPVASFASPSSSAGEASGAHGVTVSLSHAPEAALTLNYSVGGTATEDVDFAITGSGTLAVAQGDATATIAVSLTDDTAVEGGETVVLTLTDGGGYTVGSPNEHTLTVVDDDAPTPTVSVTASPSQVEEGEEITFTVSRSGPTGAPLTVTLDIAESANFVRAEHEGSKTVTIPTGAGSAQHYVSTRDDNEGEPDGTVTATVLTGSGYDVGSPSSATVAVEDDDGGVVPAVSVSGPASVTEGGAIDFTLSADPAPASSVTVVVDIAESGDFAEPGETGQRSVPFAAGVSQATVTVRTDDDGEDEPHGSVTVTVLDRDGYSVSGGSATTAVRDNDTASRDAPTLTIYDGGAKEGRDMAFRVDLSQAPGSGNEYVQVEWHVEAFNGPDAATLGQDVPDRWGQVAFREGETRQVFTVPTYRDAHDDPNERFRVVLRNPKRYRIVDSTATLLPVAIADGEAIGTILNTGSMPREWLARFGRGVAQTTIDGIRARMEAARSRTAGFEGSLGGAPIAFGGEASGAACAAGEACAAMSGRASDNGDGGFAGIDGRGPGGALGVALDGGGLGAGQSGSFSHAGPGMAGQPHAAGGGHSPYGSQSDALLNLLLGSRFTLTQPEDRWGDSLAFWGRGARSSFHGALDDGLGLDGEIVTGTLGADYARGDWLFGLTLSQSEGRGGYRGAEAENAEGGPGMGGRVESSLMSAVPWAAWRASERLEVWGAAGYGTGDVTLRPGARRNDPMPDLAGVLAMPPASPAEPEGSGEILTAGTAWTMAAAGLRADLFGHPGGGPALAVVSDALWTRTDSERISGLAATSGAVSRLRLGFEGGWAFDLGRPGRLTPRLELGARHDGGDAETGFGVELGGVVAWEAPALGIRLDLEGRTLISHEDGGFEDRGFSASFSYDPAPSSGRGLSMRMRQEAGRPSGGIDALFAPDPLSERIGSEAPVRWAMETAYGFPAFGGRFIGSPYAELGLASGARDYSLGWRLAPEVGDATDLTFGVKATRRESDTEASDHRIGVELRARW